MLLSDSFENVGSVRPGFLFPGGPKGFLRLPGCSSWASSPFLSPLPWRRVTGSTFSPNGLSMEGTQNPERARTDCPVLLYQPLRAVVRNLARMNWNSPPRVGNPPAEKPLSVLSNDKSPAQRDSRRPFPKPRVARSSRAGGAYRRTGRCILRQAIVAPECAATVACRSIVGCFFISSHSRVFRLGRRLRECHS